MAKKNTNGIGTLSEKSLHASLKNWYAKDGDLLEEKVDGYHIDVKRGPLLIEIQSKNFSAIKKKLSALLPNHSVLLAMARLVRPLPKCRNVIAVTSVIT